MRRFLQIGLGLWFAISITWAQACVPASQAADPYSSTNPSARPGSVGKNSGAADPPSGYGSASPVGDPHVDTRSYRADQGESEALTRYLKAHRLPLVGAQVLDGSGGKRAVVLYGFVGTDFGKSDAAAKSQRFLAGPSVLVDNRIKVRPELLASGGASTPRSNSSSPDAESTANNGSYPGADSYVQEQNQNPAIQQYQQQQQQGAAMSTAMLIAMIALMGLSMASGGGVSVGPGSMGPPGGFPPFGPPAPYNPYPGYPSPGYPGYPSAGNPGYPPSSGSPFGSYP
jgi:hypothetical protein